MGDATLLTAVASTIFHQMTNVRFCWFVCKDNQELSLRPVVIHVIDNNEVRKIHLRKIRLRKLLRAIVYKAHQLQVGLECTFPSAAGV